MVVLIIVAIGLGVLEYFVTKNTVFGFVIPFASLGYLLYSYIVQHNNWDFTYIDLLVPAVLFVVTTVVWVCMEIIKRKSACNK